MLTRKLNYFYYSYRNKYVFDHVNYFDNYQCEFVIFNYHAELISGGDGGKVLANVKEGIRKHKKIWHKK